MSPMLTSGYSGIRFMGLIVRCWWLGLDLYVDLLRPQRRLIIIRHR